MFSVERLGFRDQTNSLVEGVVFGVQCFGLRELTDVFVDGVQGYLTHKKTPPRRTLQEPYAWGPRGVLGGWACSDGRGTPEVFGAECFEFREQTDFLVDGVDESAFSVQWLVSSVQCSVVGVQCSVFSGWCSVFNV